MPGTDFDLVDVLGQMFAAAGKTGSDRRRLGNGLHVKVGLRGAQRMVILWRDGDRMPSRTECQIVSDDAGFYAPYNQSWKIEGVTDSAILIRDSYRGELCSHNWSTPTDYVVKRTSGYTATCLLCGAVWRQEKRQKHVHYVYNGESRRESMFDRLLVLGPVPADAEALAPQTAPVAAPEEARPDLDELPPPVQLSWKEQRAEKDKEAKRRKDAIEQARIERERPIVALYVQVLTLCTLGMAVRHPGWFDRAVVMRARVAWIKGAKLAELREDLHGRHGRSMLGYSVPMLLLALRWPQIMRALPAQATVAAAAPAKPARKPRAPRKPRAKAVEAA